MPSTTPEPLRLFFALWPDAAVRGALARLAAAAGDHGRPVARDNLHLTLAFLGTLDATRLAAVRDAAARVDAEPFRLTLDRIDRWRRPRLICAVPSAPPDALLRLAGELSEAMRALDLPIERRPFAPHVTLVRRAGGEAPPAPPEAPVTWDVDRFALVASRPSEEGVRYTPLAHWPVAKSTPL